MDTTIRHFQEGGIPFAYHEFGEVLAKHGIVNGELLTDLVSAQDGVTEYARHQGYCDGYADQLDGLRRMGFWERVRFVLGR